MLNKGIFNDDDDSASPGDGLFHWLDLCQIQLWLVQTLTFKTSKKAFSCHESNFPVV